MKVTVLLIRAECSRSLTVKVWGAITTLLVLLISGCASTPEPVIPGWVQSPPQDTEQFIYGVGSGQSVEVSNNTALAHIADKLNAKIVREISVSASQLQSGSVDEKDDAKTKAKVTRFELSNYRVEKNENDLGRYWSLAVLSRQDYLNTQLAVLADIDQRIQRLIRRFEKYSDLQRLTISDELGSEIEAAHGQLVLLSAAGDISKKADALRYSSYRRGIRESSERLVLSISADQESMPIAKQLQHLLTDFGISAAFGKQGSVVNLETTIVRGDRAIDGAIEVQLFVDMTTRDEQRSVLGRREYMSMGKSYQSEEHALELASSKLVSRLQRKSFSEVLGLIE